jgi:hypothetical protein
MAAAPSLTALRRPSRPCLVLRCRCRNRTAAVRPLCCRSTRAARDVAPALAARHESSCRVPPATYAAAPQMQQQHASLRTRPLLHAAVAPPERCEMHAVQAGEARWRRHAAAAPARKGGKRPSSARCRAPRPSAPRSSPAGAPLSTPLAASCTPAQLSKGGTCSCTARKAPPALRFMRRLARCRLAGAWCRRHAELCCCRTSCSQPLSEPYRTEAESRNADPCRTPCRTLADRAGAGQEIDNRLRTSASKHA